MDTREKTAHRAVFLTEGIYGFRLGARMILDIIGDYEGQFEAG